MVFDIRRGTKPSELSDEDALRLLGEMERNRKFAKAARLAQGEIKPESEFDEMYLALRDEVQKRNLKT